MPHRLANRRHQEYLANPPGSVVTPDADRDDVGIVSHIPEAKEARDEWLAGCPGGVPGLQDALVPPSMILLTRGLSPSA